MGRSDEALQASCTQADGSLARGWGGPVWDTGVGTRADPSSLQCCRAHRSERETAVRISQEIGNLMKEIETLVEEKTKESLDVSRLTREGEASVGGSSGRQQWAAVGGNACPSSPGGSTHRVCSAHHMPASAWVADARTYSTCNTPTSYHPDSPENGPLARKYDSHVTVRLA